MSSPKCYGSVTTTLTIVKKSYFNILLNQAWYNSSDGSFAHQFTINGCCVDEGVLHRNCICKFPSSSHPGSLCERTCSEDIGCKGYSIQDTEFPNNKRLRYCMLSTTSRCPSDCDGPFSNDNTQGIDSNATSGTCFIKKVNVNGKVY